MIIHCYLKKKKHIRLLQSQQKIVYFTIFYRFDTFFVNLDHCGSGKLHSQEQSSLHSSFSSSPQLATCESKARPQRLVKAFLLLLLAAAPLTTDADIAATPPPAYRRNSAALYQLYCCSICVSSRFSSASRFFTLFDKGEKSKKTLSLFLSPVGSVTNLMYEGD